MNVTEEICELSCIQNIPKVLEEQILPVEQNRIARD